MAADGSLPFADMSDVLDDGYVGSSKAANWKQISQKSLKPGGINAQWPSDKGPVIASSVSISQRGLRRRYQVASSAPVGLGDGGGL
ncbi:hypothetical protein JOB18_000536 [Solea senegalensis]|uniref:Uncharacterized protein n=1 Tax=Solea senegalensis TaxID=28829 RepID=A0AAV6SQ81_SOLSE|nr:hypothetical protein JOB18_000536 [Solea senegalensis]